jgi:2',3'-cyclic-nucleotide 2'-phosphodiesterase (5'-nucleotidase family)
MNGFAIGQRLRSFELGVLPALLGAAALACSGDPELTSSSAQRVVLLYTSDEHSQALAFRPELDDYPLASGAGSGALRGGLARRKVLLERERAAAKAEGKSVLTVSAGDNQMGTLVHVGFRTHSLDYGSMVELGYDVTTLGNHEFDFGPQALAEALDAARSRSGAPPIVATNIHFSESDPADDALAAHMGDHPSDGQAIHRSRIITTPEGVRVGFVGIMGVNASSVAPAKKPVSFSESNPGNDELAKIFADLQPAVDALRASGDVHLVVALSHSGIIDPSQPESGEDSAIAKNVAGLDVIISGHEHNSEPEPVIVQNETTGRDVVILHAGALGGWLGRVELEVRRAGDPPKFHASSQTLISVDDQTPPAEGASSEIDALIAAVEQAGALDGKTYLEGLLSRVEGVDVTDGGEPGDLYFRQLGSTSFDLTDTHSMLFLTADAQLSAVTDVAPAQMGLQSAGVIRTGLRKGNTGVLSASDVFNVVPLGSNPLDGTYGYPLVVARLGIFYVWAIFEFAASWGGKNGDYDLATSAVRVEYDCSRPKVETLEDLFSLDKGVVSKIFLDTDHSDGLEQFDQLIWDRTDPSVAIKEPIAIVTSSYICEFADSVGAAPLGADGKPLASCADGIVQRPDGRDVKEVEALMRLIKTFPDSTMPARYDRTSPQRTQRFEAFPGCR